MKDIRIREYEAEGSTPKGTINLEFTYSESPRGGKDTDPKGKPKLTPKKPEEPVHEDERTGEPTGKPTDEAAGERDQEYDESALVTRSRSRFERPEDFPLAHLCAEPGPLHVRFQFAESTMAQNSPGVRGIGVPLSLS